MRRSIVFTFAILAWGAAVHGLSPAQAAEKCTAADFGAVVDQTAQALRDLNVNGANRFQEKLKAQRASHGLSQEDVDARVASLQDGKMEEFNREIEGLVAQMDALSQTPNSRVTCQKLEELKRVRDKLLTVMGQKSGYMLARADALLDKPAAARPAKPATATNTDDGVESKGSTEAAKPAAYKPQIVADNTAKPSPFETKAETPKPDPVPALPSRRPPVQTASGWTPKAHPVAAESLNVSQPTRLQAPPADYGQLPQPSGAPGDTTFSMDEIREAGRGLFGTITAEFAGAINYAFQNFGQPNAYIVGGEGGGAFLAGLRYGKGTLHRKGAEVTRIYWQGPSAGLDLGADGSNALFLVYNVPDGEAIYGRFTGIGGTAYVAGGVGINVLGKGKMVMVPIRSGIGLRLGANLAYLKFTDRQTWNPF